MSLILSGTDGLSDVDGSAATPAIRGTDANTGIFFGTDIIGFSEGGVEAMRIDSAGNVGIGTNSPAAKLDVTATLRAVSSTPVAPTSGKGVEIWYETSGDYGRIATYDRTGAAYKNQYIDGAALYLNSQSSGNVGIGTSSPLSTAKVTIKQASGGGTGSTQLHLEQSNSTDGYDLKCDSANGALAFLRYESGSATERMRISSTGQVTIASDTLYITNIPTTATAGNCLISSGEGNKFYRSTSSLKYKRNVTDMQRGVQDVLQLRPVNFSGVSDFDGDKLFAGFIAEEVESLGFKEFVIYDENGEPDGLQYANMTALLVKAIQEQQALITALTARITALENK
jgi:hypothetical protein